MTDLAMTARQTPQTARSGRINPWVVALAAIGLVLGALSLAQIVSWRQGVLYLIGGALGLVLYHALFGFTSAWRVFIADKRGEGLRAQMLMLAVAVCLFFPALSAGSILGQPVYGFVAPVGVSVIFGAFVFGIGMQLGGGCGSGTLYTIGGGSTRMIITLLFFIIGSVLGAWHLPWWSSLPSLQPVSFVHELGLWWALGLHLLAFAAIALVTIVLERRRHGKVLSRESAPAPVWRRLLRGPWPLVWGALALAILNFVTLMLAGRPWGITSAFALWGSKILATTGIDVASWGFWRGNPALTQSVFMDVTSVMDFGIVLGALLAAGLAGKFAPTFRIPLRSLIAAMLGGLLLGYGARLSFGCNIGAFFSGIASSSLHGWVWLVAAFVGNIVGTRLRPVCGLEVERTPRQAAC